ncbi:MAG: hypothetical protein KJ607_01345 [Bacteroidetes bacterium]|nr:hypothetical protein [Bacteroidota bacterium]
MKRIINITLIVLLPAFCMAQNEVDALRYSQTFYGGTARSLSMGGAFGALGGDFSCLSYNPAGIAVYRHSELTCTPALYFSRTNTTFQNTGFSDFRSNLNANNLGIIATYTSGRDDGWTSVNFGFGMNRLNNYYNNFILKGTNNESSYVDMFADLAENHNADDLGNWNVADNDFGAGLACMAYNTWLIDPDTNVAGNRYVSNFKQYGQSQEKTVSQKGQMSEMVVTLGGNYSHKLYMGGTVGFPFFRYVCNGDLTEIRPSADTLSLLEGYTYSDELVSHGVGFNLKLGIIYRPVEFIRIGLAAHTPTFFNIDENYTAEIASEYNDASYSSSAEVESSYNLATPFKAIGSVAFIIMKSGLVSVDYEYVDYSTIQMSMSDYSFTEENQTIRNAYVATGNLHVGAEYRYGPFSFRGGFMYYGSPYASSTPNSGAGKLCYTGGIGIKDNNIYFDLGYVYTTYSEKYFMYSPDLYPVESANVAYTTSRILATFGVKF